MALRAPVGFNRGDLLSAGQDLNASQEKKMTSQPPLPILESVPTYRRDAIEALVRFRLQREEHVEGNSLLNVTASADLLPADAADRLGLTAAKRLMFLGKLLTAHRDNVLSQQEDTIVQQVVGPLPARPSS